MSLVTNTSNTPNHKRNSNVDIQELERKAEIVEDQDLSIESWITQANRLYDQAKMSNDKGDLENAYVQYLKFNNIVTSILPQHQVELRKRALEVASILKQLRSNLARKSDDIVTQGSYSQLSPNSGIAPLRESSVSNHAQELIRKFTAMAGASQASPTAIPRSQPFHLKAKNQQISSVHEDETKINDTGSKKLTTSSSKNPNSWLTDAKSTLRVPPRPKGSESHQKLTKDKSNSTSANSVPHTILKTKPISSSTGTTNLSSPEVAYADTKSSNEINATSSSPRPLIPTKSKRYIPTSVFTSYRLEKRKSNVERRKSGVSTTDLEKNSVDSAVSPKFIVQSQINLKESNLVGDHQQSKAVIEEDPVELIASYDKSPIDSTMAKDALPEHISDTADDFHTHDPDLYESALRFPHIDAIQSPSLSETTSELELNIDEVAQKFPNLERDGSIRTALLNAQQAKVRRQKMASQQDEEEKDTQITPHEEEIFTKSPAILQNKSLELNDSTSSLDDASEDVSYKEANDYEAVSPLSNTPTQKSQFPFKHSSPSRRWSSSTSISQTSFAFPHATVISTETLHQYLTQAGNPPSILLMDIRPREDFQKGHIDAKYIINIDPMILKHETTSSKIEAALLVCSKREQLLFNERHKVDLIVFYDQNSSSLTQRPVELGGNLMSNPLQHLVSAIYEREFEKVLIRMPVLLNGGFEAWRNYYGEASSSIVKPPVNMMGKANSEENISTFLNVDKQIEGPKTEPKQNISDDWFNKLQDTYSKSKGHRLNRVNTIPHQIDALAEKLDRSTVITPAIGRPIALEIYDYFQQNPVPSQSADYRPYAGNGLSNPNTESQYAFHLTQPAPPGPILPKVDRLQQPNPNIQQLSYSSPPRRSLPQPQPQPQPQHYQQQYAYRPLAHPAVPQQLPVENRPRPSYSKAPQPVNQLGFHPQQYPAYPPHPNPIQYQHTHQMQQQYKHQDTRVTQPPKRSQPQQHYTSTQTQKAIPAFSNQQTQQAPLELTQEGESTSNLRRRKTFLDNPYYGFTTTNSIRYDPPPPVPKRPLPQLPMGPLPQAYRVNQQMPSVAQSQNQQWQHPYPIIQSAPSQQHAYGQQHMLPVHIGSPTFESSVSQLGSVRIGITGLKNLGNTCFMNSILQCLSATVPLARYFLDGSYKRHINATNFLGTGGVLAQAFGDLIRVMWSEQYTFVSPITFRDAIAKFAPQFKGSDQQDSQELLGFLLDGLHEDLNLIVTKPPPDNNEDDDMMEKMPEHLSSDLAWEKYLLRNSSIIVSLFQGQFRSRLQCTSCKQTSTTYNPFMYLSLPIPLKGNGIPLSRCLDEFVKEEILDGDDAWFCSRCKTRRRAIKRLTLSRLPDILLIHLKRFSFSGPFRDKLDTLVSYPLRKLDMRPYLPPTQSKAPAIYDLYAVSNHFGGLNGGHYTAQVRNGYRNQWHNFDDSRVSACDERSIVCKSAYILFYVRTTVS
ncbi:ubiquitin-specific protease doa4 [Basidiobolus ranarum]|uniref:ubiquitinyl hydrolase 1 n=2 Tax=Basidiobolus ranarum TaxID=34480 RepID=A0ABR2VWP8_9FUNG